MRGALRGDTEIVKPRIVYTRINNSDYKKIKKISKDERIHVSEFIRRCISEELKKWDK